MSAHLLPALEPITSRVRTDVTARSDERGMIWTREPLTEERLLAHLNGGPARGVCPIKAGESTTRVALFDLDSHKGQTPWSEMVKVAELLYVALETEGCYPVAIRSRGGRGVHVFVIWDEPQDAYSVRVFMREVLSAIGLRDGTGGVANGQVEVFPKQDAVPAEGFGNQFILPLAGRSEPLEPLLGFEPAGRDHALAIEWKASPPVPVVEKPSPAERRERGPVGPELERFRSALAKTKVDTMGRDEWRNTVFALHYESGGSEEGFGIADSFSRRFDTYDYDELRAMWDNADPVREKPITGASILFRARADGWTEEVSPEDFPILLTEPDLVDDGPVTRVLDPKSPMALARSVLRGAHTSAGRPVLLRAGGLWYEHTGPCWVETPEEAVRQSVWSFLDAAKKEVTTKAKDEDGKTKATTRIEPFCPQQSQVNATTDALKAVVGVKGASAPCWLPGYAGPEPQELVSLTDGLLHVPTRQLLPHTPGLFTVNTLPYGWGEDREPVEWLKFLEAVWPGDPEAQGTLQEMFGYLLTADTSQQKMFLIQGPKRSGKGTIARVLGALLGRENMVSPTLTSLTSNFGLQPLIDKLVAMIPDARVGAQTNTQAVVEKLLMLSGEDSITVDRKNKEAWTGRLSARVVIMTNEVPQLGDASGALAGRFVTIAMRQSFYGREDLGLTDRLLKELPGIFRWALDGRDRLNARGYFVQPKSAEEVAEDLFESSSPISVFVEDVMERGAGYTVSVSEAYQAWSAWCGENGRAHPGTLQTFSRMLRAAEAGVSVWRPRTGPELERKREFTSIRIKQRVREQYGLFPE